MGLFATKRPPARPDLQTGYVNAPIGGINTVDVATAMPPGDAIYLWNLIPAEYGLRSRLGYQEWAIEIGHDIPAGIEVRTVIPFVGTNKTGSTNKLYAAGNLGLYDCTSKIDAPAPTVSFGTTTGEAGYGAFTMATTPAGRFGLYTDEENGLFEYSETGAAWSQIPLSNQVAWTATTAYLVGDNVFNGTEDYVCTTAGTSAGSGGPTGTGVGIVDGTVHWSSVRVHVTAGIGPSLADQRNGYTGNPANFAFVLVWKNRVFLVEKNTTRAWYLNVNSVTGVATSFDFGSKMKAGGPLVGLYNWSYDGGSGMDTLLVGISTAGDVVIYQGTDPTSANTFGVKGCWSLGAVPYGRRIATDFGGDILVLSNVGIIQLSTLVTGKTIVNEEDSKSVYATGKIANLFNVLTSATGNLIGWALHIHPVDNALLVLVPQSTGQPTQQLAMSLATKAWCRYRDVPMMSAGVWGGQLYFGTNDGRICLNSGYVDDVAFDGSSSTPVAFSGLTAFENEDNSNVKKVELVIPELLSQSSNPLIQVTPLYDLNTTEPAPPTGSSPGGSSAWDTGKWDAAVWGGDYEASSSLQGALGCGRSVALAFRGTASARTVINGFHVMYREGGPL